MSAMPPGGMCMSASRPAIWLPYRDQVDGRCTPARSPTPRPTRKVTISHSQCTFNAAEECSGLQSGEVGESVPAFHRQPERNLRDKHFGQVTAEHADRLFPGMTERSLVRGPACRTSPTRSARGSLATPGSASPPEGGNGPRTGPRTARSRGSAATRRCPTPARSRGRSSHLRSFDAATRPRRAPVCRTRRHAP